MPLLDPKGKQCLTGGSHGLPKTDKPWHSAVMALAGMYHSRLWQTYWQAQRKAA